MATTRSVAQTRNYEHSPFIAERRRRLFPIDGQETDTELGPISPLHADHLDIEPKTPRSTRLCSDSMSPLVLSPYIHDTPIKFTHSRNLKTPHDTSTKPILEKHQRALTEESKKRPMESPGTSPECPKSESKVSKVRTALFSDTEDNSMALSTQSFYSKGTEQDTIVNNLLHKDHNWTYKPVKFHATKHKRERRLGQINNGVRHNIRRPKLKKTELKRALPNTPGCGGALNEYLQDLAELKKKDNGEQKLIQQPLSKEDEMIKNFLQEAQPKKKQIKTFTSNDKENNKPGKRTRSASSSFEEEKNKKSKLDQTEPPPSLDMSNNDFQEDDPGSALKIDSILKLLSSPCKEEHSSKISFSETSNQDITTCPASRITFVGNKNSHMITLEAHSSVTASENAIQLHVSNSILSPISQMCDVTSGLAINSPNCKRVAPLKCSSRVSKMLSFNEPCSTDMAEQDKLFPIFYKEQAHPGVAQKRPSSDEASKRSAKRFKALAPDQMLLDAGQKNFGLTQCKECNIWYHMGDPNDEKQHMEHHTGQHVLKFAGWKNERVVAEFPDKKRIIKVLPTDSKIWLSKVSQVMDVVKRELGCYEMEANISQSQVYIYVNNHTIVGCTVAVAPKGQGHRMLKTLNGVAMCSEESYPIKCGISHIWVSGKFRKQGIARAMLDSIKNSFLLGEILSNDDIALTSPTEAGSAFAEKYFKSPNYLVYFI